MNKLFALMDKVNKDNLSWRGFLGVFLFYFFVNIIGAIFALIFMFFGMTMETAAVLGAAIGLLIILVVVEVNHMSQNKKQQIRKAFREAVFKRDDYTCVGCGKKYTSETMEKIDSHHITQWRICS
jgi:predicted membrane protein